MEFQQQRTSKSLFSHYTSDSLVLGEARYTVPLSVLPNGLEEEAFVQDYQEPQESVFEWVLSLVPSLLKTGAEVILIGTGMRLRLPSLQERKRLQESGLFHMEWMDTP